MYVIYDSRRDRTNVAVNTPLQINSCGINTTRRSGKPIDKDVLVQRPDGRLDYQLLYMVSGHAEFFLNDEWVTVGEGKIVLYRPHEPQIYRTYSQVAMLCRWVHFSGTEVAAILEECGMGQGNLFLAGMCPGAESLFKAMTNEMLRQGPLYQTVVNAQFRQLLALLGRQLLSQQDAAVQNGQEKILSVMEYINRHYFESINTEELAQRCGLSKYHFLHLFKQCTGMSPYAYLIQTRMERAKTLLESGEMAIWGIASVCGYTDPLYFSRAFSKLYGLSPTDYQREFRQEAQTAQQEQKKALP